MTRKKLTKHQVQYHMLNTQQSGFISRKILPKHEQNVVKSGLNFIPAGDVNMR